MRRGERGCSAPSANDLMTHLHSGTPMESEISCASSGFAVPAMSLFSPDIGWDP